jgi:HEPN domain-containing protein
MTEIKFTASGDAKSIFDFAEDFFQGLNQLHRADRRVKLKIVWSIGTLSAFTSELYLKCLITRESGKPPRGHYLKNLFDRLSPITQQLLERQWSDITIRREATYRQTQAERGKPMPRELRTCLREGNKGFELLR